MGYIQSKKAKSKKRQRKAVKDFSETEWRMEDYRCAIF